MQVPILKNLTANIGLGMKSLYVGSQFCLPGPLLTSFSIRSDWKVHPSARPVSGVVFVSTPFVIIRWSWLSYLLVELVLSSLFLFCIIIWTTPTKSEALRVSTLATLCALDEPTRQQLGHIGDHEEIRQRTAEFQIMLVDGPDGLASRGVR